MLENLENQKVLNEKILEHRWVKVLVYIKVKKRIETLVHILHVHTILTNLDHHILFLKPF